MKKQTILIIGAGSTGLSVALELARLGGSKVVVIDKGFVGSGQTGHCCGFVRSFYNVPEMAFSAFESMKRIKNICRTRNNLEYVKKGLLVVDELKNGKKIRKNVNLLRSLGVRAKYFEEGEINKIYPYLITKRVCAGFDEEAGFVNPQLMVNYLERECRKLSVKIVEKLKLTGLRKRNGFFYAKTKQGEIKADKVVNATAVFANTVNAMLDIDLPVKVIKINNVFYRLPMGVQEHSVAVADFVNLFYMIVHKDFIDVSTMALDLKKEVDPENCDDLELDHEVIGKYLNLISKRVKGAYKSAILGGFGSCIDVTKDYYPILGSVDKVPNYYFATGFSGTGFKHFPVIGKLMAEIVLEKEPTYPDLISFFRRDRFGRGSARKSVSDSYFVKE
jgi:sarcosine oxidase subunit beta